MRLPCRALNVKGGSKQARVKGRTVSVSAWWLWCVSLWMWLWLWSWCMCVCGVVWHVHNAPRLYIQNVPVCTGTTRVLATSGRFADTHGDVLNVHTGGVLNVPHHTAHTNATSHGDGQRERARKKTEEEEREETTRGGRKEEEREKKEKKSVLTCTRVACTCRRHSFGSFYHEIRSFEHLHSMMSAFRSF